MKRCVGILLLAVLLCGCGEEPEQTFATRPPAETVRYGHTPVESAPTAPAEEETDEVRVQLNGPLSPIKILPREGEHFLFLVLPVRLRSGE